MKRTLFAAFIALLMALSLVVPTVAFAATRSTSAIVNDLVDPPHIACYDALGRPQRGWVTFGKHTFYCNDEGVALTGWQDIEGSWYWFDAHNAVMATGLAWADGGWHSFADNGAWLGYAPEPQGSWEQDGDSKRFRLEDGSYLADCICELGGKGYAFRDDGTLSVNEYVLQKVPRGAVYPAVGQTGVSQDREAAREFTFYEMWPNNLNEGNVSAVSDHASGAEGPYIAAIYVSDMYGQLWKGWREIPFPLFTGHNRAELAHAPAVRSRYYFTDDYSAARHRWVDEQFFMGDGWLLNTADVPFSGGAEVTVPDGLYTIRSAIGEKSLDVVDAGEKDEANAQLWVPRGNSSQVFRVSANSEGGTIALAATNKLLYSEGALEGSNVRQSALPREDVPTWTFEDAGDGFVYIRNPYGGYLDVAGSENRNGANVEVWEFNGTAAQRWKLVPTSGVEAQRLPGGAYILRSAVGDRVLDIANASRSVGANAQLWEPTGGAAQIFAIDWQPLVFANNIRLAQSGNENLWLDAEGGDGQVNVWQYEGNGGYAQNWFFEPAGNGYYYIRNLLGYYLDVVRSGTANGTNVQVWEFNGSEAQRWLPVRVSGSPAQRPRDGRYAVRSGVDGRVLSAAGGAGSALTLAEGGEDPQAWLSLSWDESRHALRVMSDDLLLDARGGDGETVAQLWSDNGGYAQRWFVEEAPGGRVFLRNILGYYLTASEGSVRVAAFDGSDGQTWTLDPEVALATAEHPEGADPNLFWPQGTDHWVDWGDSTPQGAHWYVYRDGELRRGCWVELKGAWYYLGSDGEMLAGKQRLSFGSRSGYYFFNPAHDGTYGRMRTGWFYNDAATFADGDNAWYYMEPQAGTGYQGICVTGKRTIEGVTYIFDAEGRMVGQQAVAPVAPAH